MEEEQSHEKSKIAWSSETDEETVFQSWSKRRRDDDDDKSSNKSYEKEKRRREAIEITLRRDYGEASSEIPN